MRIGIGIAIIFLLGMYVQRELSAPPEDAFACGLKIAWYGDDPCRKIK
jgi:hypothetical protein